MVGEERTIERDGVHIVYQLRSAPAHPVAVVCLHGVASNATRFHEWMSESALSNRYPLIAIDQRGHGRSMTYAAYTRADFCADVHAVLTQEHNQAILLGHSLGAQVALEFAAQYPQLVKGLILIDPVFPQALTGTLRNVARWRVLLRVGIACLRGFHRIGLGKRSYPYRSLYQLDLQTRAYLAAHPDEGIAKLYMDPFADLEFMPLTNYLQDLYEVTRPLRPFNSITSPVLVLLSKGASTSNVSENHRILAGLPQCEIQVIDADHWLLTERPEEARSAIDNWCLKILQT